MEPERIELSQRERDRLKVLHEVDSGHLTQVEAAGRLKLSDRQVRRLLVRLHQHGDRALVHGLRGRPSNRRLPAPFAQRVLTRVRQRYADLAGAHQASRFEERASASIREYPQEQPSNSAAGSL